MVPAHAQLLARSPAATPDPGTPPRRPGADRPRPGRTSPPTDRLVMGLLAALAVAGCAGTSSGQGGGPAGTEDARPAADTAAGPDAGPATSDTTPADGVTPDAGTGGEDPGPPPDHVDLDRYDPRLWRPDEISLAGEWLFAFDGDGRGEDRGLAGSPDGYDLRIVVPFPWQSVLSGVGPEPPSTYAAFGSEAALHTWRGVAWAAREVTVPPAWPTGERVVLRFGAVDWAARVFVDGVEVGAHTGGYTPFDVDLTEHVTPGQPAFVAVRMDDPCDGDDGVLAGKQGDIWYTCAGGMWQDVLLLHRPAAFIRDVEDLPADGDALTLRVHLGGADDAGEVRVQLACLASCGAPCGPAVATAPRATGQEAVDVTFPDLGAPLWTPGRPCLLGRTATLTTGARVDTVSGYAAARRIERRWVTAPDDPAGYQGFAVGGEPTEVRGVLDQGYDPRGLITPPSRAARREELTRIRDAGFNTVRIHIKPEEPSTYAACDVLGLLVVYDLPCPMALAPSGAEAAWRPAWEPALRELVARDKSHPSILWWVLFNEAWGLLAPPFWITDEGKAYVTSMVDLARTLDPSRPVEDNSPGGVSELLYGGALPHLRTDVLSYHLYDRDPAKMAARTDALVQQTYPGSTATMYGDEAQAGQPLILSEIGPFGADDTRGDLFWPLHGVMNAVRSAPKVQGWVLTQATDVEWEQNGLLRYDRTPKVTGLDALGLTLADLFGPAHLALGVAPGLVVAPGEALSVPMTLHAPGLLPADVTADIALGPEPFGAPQQTVAAAGGGPDILAIAPAAVPAPQIAGVYVLSAVARSGGEPLARDAIYVVVDDGAPAPAGALEGAQWATGDAGELLPGAAVRCGGDCALEATVVTPGPGTYAVRLVAEVASHDPAGGQTDATPLPSTLTVTLDGAAVATVTLPDAPHDHRGVLSHLLAPSLRGAWGERVDLDLGVHPLGAAVTLGLAAEGHGVQLFFRRAGRLLEHPRLELTPGG